MSFIEELKRRNVFRVGVAYLVVGWLVMQVLEIVLESFGSPAWVMKTVLVVLAAGLPFALLFAWAFEMTPEGLKKEKDVDRSQSITHQTGRKLDFIVIGILVLALGYFAYDKFVLDPARDAELIQTAESVESATVEPEELEKSIAVLPFVNMSSDTEQEYFSDGISEEILNALAKIEGLQVTGRTSSFAFKGENQDLRQIGETLGVAHILEGSVRKSGNTVRITAQLVRVDNGFHLWSETYDRELDNVFAIQDEIASNILQELQATLLDDDEIVVSSIRTNPEAYDMYLLAKQRMYERTGPTIESAAELLDKAIAIDPEYAPAYAQRGVAALLLREGTGTYGNIPAEQAQTQGKLYLDKAIELDPDLAEAWAGLGLYYMGRPTNEDQLQSIKVLRKALELNPGLMDASNWLHNVLQNLGRPLEARDVVMGMIERDPLYPPGLRNAVNNYIRFGQQDQALAFLDKIRPMISNDAVMLASEANIRQSLGEHAEAARLAQQAVELKPSDSVVHMTRSFVWMGLHEYDAVATEDKDFLKVLALAYLDRTEEASLLAFERADEQADVSTLFTFLNTAGRSDELISYLEERWPDLDALRADFPPYAAFGDDLMLNVALAYSRAGNQQRFNEAMEHVRIVHERLITMGVINNFFFMNEASHQTMAGNLDSGLEFLDRAVTGGFISTTRIAQGWPFLASLEGDPRFEAIQTRMIDHLNSEREKMGLEPGTI